ncbi:MAG TPA: FAD-dependent oxidoreductase [Thermoleophilia bacterium]|nr:FAD-dependent oxidoreductase [Thermoleophilia bacterium]
MAPTPGAGRGAGPQPWRRTVTLALSSEEGDIVSGREDVLVVGGGVVGACVAAALAERGAAVTLLEREPEVCPPESAVFANCGLLVPSEVEPLAHPGALGQGLRWMLDTTSPFYVRPRVSLALMRWLWLFRSACAPEAAQAHARVLFELSAASAALHDALAADGGEAWHYRRNGWLAVYETAQGMDAAAAQAARLQTLGVPSEVLSAADVRQRVPQVRPGSVVGGVLTPEDGHMDPAAFTRAMASRAERAGATIATGAEVYGFASGGPGAVRGVRTTRGDFVADQVVLAAGAWTAALAGQLGLRLPIEPAKGYSIDLARPAGLPDTPICVGEPHVVLTPLGDRLRLGSTLELSGWDLRIRPRRLTHLRRAADRVLGIAEDAPAGQVWRGPRPLTPDGLPVIGRSPRHPNVVFATGHCMLGLSLGPVTGKLVAELCAGETPSHDLEPLRVDRFAL